MSEFRHFGVSPECITGNEIILTGNEHRHLFKVLRMNEEDEIVVFDGSGYEYACVIDDIDKKQAVLSIRKKTLSQAELPVRITLFQGSAKSDKMEYVIQKATELGADSFVPFGSDFTVAKAEGKTDRYSRIALEAAKQCARAKVMNVFEEVSFDEMTDRLSEFDRVLFCYEKEKNVTLKSVLPTLPKEGKIALIIGAEGGFSDEEARKLSEKATTVKLCGRILRTETASLFALSLIVAQTEEEN